MQKLSLTTKLSRMTNKNICEKKFFLLAFSLITIALLIAASIYCYLIKDKAKQKHISLLYVTNNKLIIYYKNGK